MADLSTFLTAPPMPPGVDTGRPCPRYHDGQIKRLYPPPDTRRAVALRYSMVPGELTLIPCQYCARPSIGNWPLRADGHPGARVHFGILHLDHVHPYALGGSTSDPDNLVLACVRCNSSKSYRLDWIGRAA